jgi:hypothetical protein
LQRGGEFAIRTAELLQELLPNFGPAHQPGLYILTWWYMGFLDRTKLDVAND